MINFVIFEIYEALLVAFQVDYFTASRRSVPIASNVVQTIDTVSFLINSLNWICRDGNLAFHKDLRPVTLLTYYSHLFQLKFQLQKMDRIVNSVRSTRSLLCILLAW